MKGQEAKTLIHNDPDFIHLKRFEFSLKKLLAKHPEGVPDRIIAAALMLTEDDVAEMYEGIVSKMRTAMKVD